MTLRKAWKRNATIGLSLAAVFGVLFVHSLSYSGFFEDPITWGALALAASVVGMKDLDSPAPAPAQPTA